MKNIIFLILLFSLESYCNDQKKINPPVKLEISVDGDPIYQDVEEEFFSPRIPFPFTDKGMKKNQFIY